MRRFYEAGILVIGLILSNALSAYDGGNTLRKSRVPYGPCTEGVVLMSQADIDAYPATYGCSQLPSLFILGNDIVNLDSLYQITTITHSLEIWGTQLQNFHGLENLTFAGSLQLQQTTLLTSLEGLSGLTRLAGLNGREGLDLERNTGLTSLSGLTSLTSVGGIKIVGNTSLVSVALPPISAVNGNVTIGGNPMLTNLDGLETITTINGFLYIYSSLRLANVSGLRALQTVTGDVRVENNRNLPNLDGLSALTIAGGLSIAFNNNLVNIDGLSALQSADWIDIRSNAGLISIDGFDSLNHIQNYLNIEANNSMQSINGFNGITAIPESVMITNNTGLKHVGGFQSLTTIGSMRVFLNTELEGITGLSHLTRVNLGEFYFSDNPKMTALNVASLKSIKGDIVFHSMAQLPNVDSLSAVGSVGGRIEVFDCANIQNIDGFSNIRSVGSSESGGMKSVIIQNNPRLKSVSGLRSITKIPTTIEFFYNDSIMSLDGLRSLKEVGDNLTLVGFKSLTNVNGLQNLTKVGGRLSIANNLAIANLDSLLSLTQVGNWLQIAHNDALTQIDGLRNITSMTGSDKELVVNFNLALTRCCGVYNLVADPSIAVFISNDGTGCTKEDILAGGPCDGTDALSDKQAFAVYPNPNRGEFTLEITNDISGPHYVTVYDILSNVVRQQVLIKDSETLTASLDLRPLSKGMYLMVIRNAKGPSLQRKIVIVD